jgi:hypothetical protein
VDSNPLALLDIVENIPPDLHLAILRFDIIQDGSLIDH